MNNPVNSNSVRISPLPQTLHKIATRTSDVARALNAINEYILPTNSDNLLAQQVTSKIKIIDNDATYLSLPSNPTSIVIECIDKDSIFDSQNSSHHITTIKIGRIHDNVIFELSDFFNNLRTLEIEHIGNNSCLILPDSLPNITTLEIKHIGNDSSPMFPDFLPKLSTLEIGDVGNDVTLKLPDSLPSLITLRIKHIGNNSCLILPDSLPNITTLEIKHIGEDLLLKLPELPNCRTKNAIVASLLSTFGASTFGASTIGVSTFGGWTFGASTFGGASTGLLIGAPAILVLACLTIAVTLKSKYEANTKLGYHFEMTPLTVDQIKPHLRYMAQAGYAHTPKLDLIKPFGYEPLSPQVIGVQLDKLPFKVESCKGNAGEIETESCFVDKDTGLKIIVSVNKQHKEIVLAFGDSNSLIPEMGNKSNAAWIQQQKAIWTNLLGKQPDLYLRADKIAIAIIQALLENSNYEKYSVRLVGQSLGGSLAQFVGLKNRFNTNCYNAVAIGKGLQTLIDEKHLDAADLYVTHVSVETDFASDLKGIGTVNSVLNSLGTRTPRNFGLRYSIPTAYPGLSAMSKTHAFHLGSAMKYIGLTERTSVKDLKDNSEFKNDSLIWDNCSV